MDLRRGNCLMTVLMLSLKAPPESELSSVPFKLIITPSGLPLHKSKMAFGRKIRKIIVSQLIRENNKLILFYINDRIIGR